MKAEDLGVAVVAFAAVVGLGMWWRSTHAQKAAAAPVSDSAAMAQHFYNTAGGALAADPFAYTYGGYGVSTGDA